MIAMLEAVHTSAAIVARSSRDPDQLQSILRPEAALAVWCRAVPVVIDPDDLESLAPIRLQAEIGAVASAVRAALGEGPARDWHAAIVDDIASLARRYAEVMDTDTVAIRLERISTNACWKFHSDYVRARMITTYYGPGTEWTISGDDGPGAVHQLGVGHVGIFKGRVWAPEPKVLHRSPPIAGTGDIRLLLVIDAVPMS